MDFGRWSVGGCLVYVHPDGIVAFPTPSQRAGVKSRVISFRSIGVILGSQLRGFPIIVDLSPHDIAARYYPRHVGLRSADRLYHSRRSAATSESIHPVHLHTIIGRLSVTQNAGSFAVHTIRLKGLLHRSAATNSAVSIGLYVLERDGGCSVTIFCEARRSSVTSRPWHAADSPPVCRPCGRRGGGDCPGVAPGRR